MKQFSGQKWSLLLMAAACVAVGLAIPSQALAQISRKGNVQSLASVGQLGAAGIKGSDVAYDPAHGVYLVVTAYGNVDAFFVDQNGVKSNYFRVKAGPLSAGGGHFPRAAYSPDVNGGAGGFLVTWAVEAGGVHTQVVAYPGVLVGSEQVISGGGLAWLESGAAVAYSPTSKVFLVAWNSVNVRLKAVAVGLDGVAVGSVFDISSGFGRDPGVAWNSARNEFGISYSGENEPYAFSCFAVVAAANPTVYSKRDCFNTIVGMTQITDLAYNPTTGHYVMVWYQQVSRVGAYAMGQEFDALGDRIGSPQILSTKLGSYDALSVAFNSLSGTFALVGLEISSDDLVGAELEAHGTRQGSEVTLGPGAVVRYPRVGASSDAAEWSASFSAFGMIQITDQIFLTATRTGPVSDVRAAIESPINGAVFGPNDTLTVSGYAADRGATSGLGIDLVAVWATPAGGSAVLVGSTSSFIARTDLAGTLGSQFVNSGFSVSKSGLAPGTYTVTAIPHSTVLNDWAPSSTWKTISVSVVGSLPLMALDAPANGSTIIGAVTASGWAIDKVASSGTGINAVHVWAFPTNGDSPRLLGAATLGLSRTDVGSFFQNSQFNNSGFSVTGYLPTGSYNLVAYARDSYSNGFNVAASKSITVRSGFIVIDAPANGEGVSLGATISGWAADLGASAGSGIDFIHVYGISSSGAYVWVGEASLGGSRPDVGAALGSSQFNNSGYSLPLQNLTAGTYTLVVFAHSSVTGANISSVVPITVN